VHGVSFHQEKRFDGKDEGSHVVEGRLAFMLPMGGESEVAVWRPGRARARQVEKRDRAVSDVVLDDCASLVGRPECAMVIPGNAL
jgi:hypothetical protein